MSVKSKSKIISIPKPVFNNFSIIKILLLLILGLVFLNLAFVPHAKAVCPVCTVAVVAGVGFSRWIGIDDLITGLWIGGLSVSLIFWLVNWMKRRKIVFKGRKIATTIAVYAIIIIPLYWTNIMGHPNNRLWGVDKLLIGIAAGSILFLSGALLYNHLKRKNNDKAHFAFQKIVMPVAPLIIVSLILYFLL